MRRLRAHVHFYEAGVLHSFGPDDPVPDWAAERITNPDAWADAGPGDGPSVTADDPDDGPAPAGPPPRAGKGSGQEHWAAYAAHVTGTEEASWTPRGRDEIVKALIDEGIIPQEG